MVKRIRTGTAQPARYESTEEPEGMVDAPVERFLKQINKGQKPEVIDVDEVETPMKKVKKERKTPKSPVKRKPLKTSTTLKKKSSAAPKTVPKAATPAIGKRIIKGLSERGKKTLRSVLEKRFGKADEDGGYSPKGTSKLLPKRKKNSRRKVRRGLGILGLPVKRITFRSI